MLALRAIFPDKASLAKLASWMGALTKANIAAKSWKYPGLPGTYVDIVYDVINPVAVQWVCDKMVSRFILVLVIQH